MLMWKSGETFLEYLIRKDSFERKTRAAQIGMVWISVAVMATIIIWAAL